MDTNTLQQPGIQCQDLSPEQQTGNNGAQPALMTAFPFPSSSSGQEPPSNFSVTPHITTPEDGQPLLHHNMLSLMSQSNNDAEPISNGHEASKHAEQSQAPKVQLQVQQLRTDALTIGLKQQQQQQQRLSLVMSSVAPSEQQQPPSQLDLMSQGQPQVDMSRMPTPALSQSVINSPTAHIELGQQPIAMMTPGSHLPMQQQVAAIPADSTSMTLPTQPAPGVGLPPTNGSFLVDQKQHELNQPPQNTSMGSENGHTQPGGADMALINGILEQDQVLQVASNDATPLPSPHEVQQAQNTPSFSTSSRAVPPYPDHQQTSQSHSQGQVRHGQIQIEQQKLQDQSQMGLHDQHLQNQNQLQLQHEQIINNMLQSVQQQTEQSSASTSPNSGHPDTQAQRYDQTQHQVNQEHLLLNAHQDAIAAEAQRMLAAQHMALAQQQQLNAGTQQRPQSAMAVAAAAAAAVQQAVMHQMASHMGTTNVHTSNVALENAHGLPQVTPAVTQTHPESFTMQPADGQILITNDNAHIASIDENSATQATRPLQVEYTAIEQNQQGTKRELDDVNYSTSRKKARRHTMSSPLPTHLSIPPRSQSHDASLPQSAAVLDGHRFGFGEQQQPHQAGYNTMMDPASALSTPGYSDSPMTPSMFSDDQKVMMLKRLAKEQQRQSLGTLTLPPRPTPAELGLKMEENHSSSSKIETRDASSSPYDNMSREQLIARLVKLENEKRAQENPENAAAITEQIEATNVKILEASDEDQKENRDKIKQEQVPEEEVEQSEKEAEEESKTKSEEPKEEVTRCLWKNCGQSFNALQDLTDHIQEIHVGSGKPTYHCEWEGCLRNQKPFTKRHKMYNHLRTHTGERPFLCPKPGCEKRFSRPDSLTTHIKTHSNVRPYVCQTEGCHKAYYHARSLKKHERVHETQTTEVLNVSFATATTYSVAGSMPVNYSVNVSNMPLQPPLSISAPPPSQMQHTPPHHQPPPQQHSISPHQPPVTPHPSEHTFRPLQQPPLPVATAVPMTQSDPHSTYTPSVPSTASQ